MKQAEAIDLLGLKKSPKEEVIVKNYKKKFLETYRSASEKGQDFSIVKEKLILLNKAYMTLDEFSTTVPLANHQLILRNGFQSEKINFNQPANFEVFPEFQRLLDKSKTLIEENKHGLALRLLEIGTERSFKLNRYKAFTGHRNLLRASGKLLVDMGLKEKGVELMTAGSINYYIGRTYFEIKDYQSAIKYFGRELQDRQAKISSVDIIMSIVKCYFLLGEYANCLHIVERVLPNFDSTKQKDWNLSEKMSKMLLFAISKEENLSKGLLVKFKLKLKYPVSYRCIAQNIDAFKEGLSFLEELGSEEDFNKFYTSIEPDYHILEKVNMEYSEEELNESYYEVFAEPMNASQLYNRR